MPIIVCAGNHHTNHSETAEALSQTPRFGMLAFFPKVLPNQHFLFSCWKHRAMGSFSSTKRAKVISVLSSPTSKEGLVPIKTKIHLRIMSFHSYIPGDI